MGKPLIQFTTALEQVQNFLRERIISGDYPGGTDYGGYPVRLAKDWRREVAALVLLAKRRKQDR